MRKTILICIAFIPLALTAQRLEVIASGGQALDRGGISITATIGEVFVAAPSGSGQFATEGFQQGYLLQEASSSRSDKSEAIPKATLFPNPAVDRLQVSLQDLSGQPVRMMLYNSIGKLITEAKTESSTHDFKVASFPAGHYWLVVQVAENGPAFTLPFEKINH